MARNAPSTPPSVAERERLVRELRAVLGRHESVRWAYLYGSAARGEPFNDVDIGLMLNDSARGAVAFGIVVADLEEAMTPHPVDVTDLASAAPALLGRIVREGIVVVDREPPVRSDWAVEANSRALDIEPWLAQYQELRLKALARRSH